MSKVCRTLLKKQNANVAGRFEGFSLPCNTSSGFDSLKSLGGGFKYFSCSPLLGEDSHFD